MKKLFFFFSALFICVSLSFCNIESEYEVKEYSQRDILLNKTDTVYDYSEVLNAAEQTNDFLSFCKRLEIKHKKTISGMDYTVINTTNCYLLVISQPNNVKTIKLNFSGDDNLNKLNEIKEGMSLEEVMNADPDGCYYSFYRERSGGPSYSTHCFRTGMFYMIYYDKHDDSLYNDTVSEIISFTL